jgi:hypothetical protein
MNEPTMLTDRHPATGLPRSPEPEPVADIRDARIAELTRQRDDALRIVISCRKAIASRDLMIARFIEVVAEQVVRITLLEGMRDLSIRAMDG